ncbi:RNA polymerase sigma factor ShbA [Pseudonocardia sp. HH130630-07]|uniref:RNA polymerase sigma factor ShbA n=1 Tax=Pseudonocardia sp. HH130630-07 TaxID=1690815 RepID=UPI000839B3D9
MPDRAAAVAAPTVVDGGRGAPGRAPGAEPFPAELLESAVHGDPDAVALLLSRVHPLVQRFCRGRLGRRETVAGSADDVAQEICMAVLAVLPGYTLSALSFRAFVFGIARHKVADVFRAMARNRCDAVEELPERTGDADDPEQVLLDAERSERLSGLLAVLGPRQAEIVTLRIAVGMTAEETAEAVGSTPGAVRVAQHRALQRLRRELDALEVRRESARPGPPVPVAVPAQRSRSSSDRLITKRALSGIPPAIPRAREA